MLPRIFCFIAVLVVCAAFASLALATSVAVNESSAPEEKVLLDCQTSDYRTYIKCLKRQKRQHSQHGDGHPNLDPDCWETCFKKCEDEHDCDKKCGHCLRKTKHKHQIITEYETECSSGNCDNVKPTDNADHLKATNITTKIDIHNVIGEKGGTCCPTCQPPVPCNNYPPRPHCNPPNCPPFPNFPITPQLTLVPQLSLGLGLSLGSPCWYPNQWACAQSSGGIDCSGCRPPYYYKCDAACYSTQGFYAPGTGDITNANVAPPCTSPQCVGGAQG